jgi:hypothetical protein
MDAMIDEPLTFRAAARLLVPTLVMIYVPVEIVDSEISGVERLEHSYIVSV